MESVSLLGRAGRRRSPATLAFIEGSHPGTRARGIRPSDRTLKLLDQLLLPYREIRVLVDELLLIVHAAHVFE
jgi:hypothetical protein